jgi:protein SCO1/2
MSPLRLRLAVRLLAASTLAAACAKPLPPGAAPSSSIATVAPVPAAPEPAERYSVYDLGSTWRDQTGARRPLASLAGRPRVVAMVYTSCAATCPLTVNEMKRIEAAVRGVDFVLVTLDPERDDPARLAAYARAHGLDAARWTLLSGAEDDVRELAAALGVRYRRISPDELAHSNALTVLDATGAVVDQQAGLGTTAETLEAVHALLR